MHAMTKARRPSDIPNSNINIGQPFRKSVMDGNSHHVVRQLGIASKQGSQTDLEEIRNDKTAHFLNVPH
jgi:hypothetical protein